MSPTEIAYLLATPLQQPSEACWISWQAKAGSSGNYALFARRNKHLIERKRNYANTIFLYRLTEEGADMRREFEARRESTQDDGA